MVGTHSFHDIALVPKAEAECITHLGWFTVEVRIVVYIDVLTSSHLAWRVPAMSSLSRSV